MLDNLQHFKTTSPQGDGNAGEVHNAHQSFPHILKPHPRKGTETYNKVVPVTMFHFKTTSPQGDGNILQWTFSGSCSYKF